MSFLVKLEARMEKVNSLLCVGLDSNVEKVPKKYQKRENGQYDFNKWIVDQTQEYVCAYKPNIAFYEGRGVNGLKQLKQTVDFIRGNYSDIPIILDAKRGDIATTNDGYVEMAFSYLGVDAITIQPYLGRETVQPFLDQKDKGIIVLCRTSNPGAGEVQDLTADGKPVWQHVAEKVTSEWNENENCLMVVGATYPEELKKVREIAGDMTFLVPGIGAQGGEVEAVMNVGMNSQKKGMIINSSRGIIFVDDPGEQAKKLRDKINALR